MTQNNLQQAAAQLAENNTDQNTGEIVNAKIEESRSKFHCAINHAPEDSNNVLVRIKELGNKSLTYKMPREAFGDQPPVKGENFTATIDRNRLVQVGNFIQGGNAMIVERDGGGERPFDIVAYMASLEASTAADAETEAPFSTEG